MMKNFLKGAVAAAVLAVVSPAAAQIGAGVLDPAYRNILDNGAFNVSQRGTTTVSSITTTGKYLQDRWAVFSGTATSASIGNVTSSLPTDFQNAVQVQRTSGQTGVLPVCLTQILETIDSKPLAGQNVTLSYWAKAGGNFSAASSVLNATVVTGTGSNESMATLISGWTGVATPVSQNATLTTSWQRFAITGTIGSTATQIAVKLCFTPVGTASTNDYFQATGIQLERGTVATNFEYRPYGVELARAQRYAKVITDAAATFVFGTCQVITANTTAVCNVPLGITMRTAPALTISTATSFGLSLANGSAGTCTTLAATASGSTENNISLTCTTGATVAITVPSQFIGGATAGTVLASADF